MITMYALVVLALVGGCLGQGYLGDEEYVLNFDSPVYLCPDDVSSKYIDTSKVDIKLVDGAAVLTGTVEFLQGVEPNTMIDMQISKEMTGRFEKVYSHAICDLCAEVQNVESKYKDYLKYFGFPEQCPFKPEVYHIHDFTIDTKDLPVNGPNAGNYQAFIYFYQTNGDCESAEKTLLTCMQIDLVIEPLVKS